MTQETESQTDELDPAAVFACALSMHIACLQRAKAAPRLNLSESYSGMDGFLRELMRVATLFETWSCKHVAFEELNDVWPYLMEDKFGEACMAIIEPTDLAGFNHADCLRVALHLRLPVRLDDKLPIPIDVRAPNPVSGSEFREFRIQTVRNDLEDGEVIPFTSDDDPTDEEFGSLYFGLYGATSGGLLEHIADRKTYSEAADLARKLAPGIVIPDTPVFTAS